MLGNIDLSLVLLLLCQQRMLVVIRAAKLSYLGTQVNLIYKLDAIDDIEYVSYLSLQGVIDI